MIYIIIKFNIKFKAWMVYINKYLFKIFIYNDKLHINKYFSLNFIKYLLMVRTLRQFGLVKVLRNKNKYVFI